MIRCCAVLALVGAMGCGRSPVDGLIRDGQGDALDGYGDDDHGANGSSQTCERVDFLFVVDNSQSMADNQAKLVANFGALLGGVEEAIEPLESMHLGVVTSDNYAHNSSECRHLGGLVVQTGGPQSSQARCGPFADGHNYMTENDLLADTFSCAASVGTDGSGSESILYSALLAVSPPLTDPGQCNAGFMRDDALLVVVLITDEDAEVDPVFAATELVTQKGSGDVVVVALGNPSDGSCGIGAGGPAFGLESFVALFRHGFMGPICADDYGDVFAEAVATIQDACPGR